ncbi:MAG: hypothetical protein Q7V57_14570 [Actinomycetota bacterium]|nr:hypothetical protein [Actinomycetota bacterium]
MTEPQPFAAALPFLAAAGGLGMDDAADTLKVLWQHRDDIVRVATKLPALLGDAGEFMHNAGQGAQRASAFLTSDIREIASGAAHALSTSTAQLDNVLTVLDNVGKAIAQVPFLDDLGEMINDGLAAIRGVATNVEAVATHMLGLGERLGDVGSDLDRVGKSLVSSGLSLADFGGKPTPKLAPFVGLPPIKPTKVTVAKVKPATAKKAPAKKAR